MHLSKYHNNNKEVSVAKIFEGTGQIISLRISAKGELKKHTTPIPALLICIGGEAFFEYEGEEAIMLKQGDYVNIKPGAPHRVFTRENSDALLLLIK